jgi:CheY-like chemotaxis protein
MLKETFPKNIEIRFDLDSSISPVSIDSGQFHQAMLNLCVNARDAVLDAVKQGSSNGLITIQTRLVNAEELIDHKIHAAMGSYVAVTVSDTGMGMSAITKQRIFEPFFTTKEPGKGTGLGLAVVYGIVKSHQGFIDVKSEIGRGTDFVLYFPARRSQATEKKPLMQSLRGVPGGSETILLVEDEMALMELLKNLLQNKGYTVLTATDGLEAVELYTRNKDTIHLVLSDHGLPKLSGSEVFKRMKQLNPKVKAILASGYIEPNQKSEIFKSGIKDFVQKPYDPQEVLRKVREVLDL